MSIRQIGVWLFGLALLGSSVGAVRMWTDTSSLRLRDVVLDRQSYEVYAAVLASRFSGHRPSARAIAGATLANLDIGPVAGGFVDSPGGCFSDEEHDHYGDALAAFMVRNRVSRQLQRRLLIGVGDEMVMSGFSRVTFSSVGFDDSRTRAVVYLECYCGPLCANGGFVLLEKREGRWMVGTSSIGGCHWSS